MRIFANCYAATTNNDADDETAVIDTLLAPVYDASNDLMLFSLQNMRELRRNFIRMQLYLLIKKKEYEGT